MKSGKINLIKSVIIVIFSIIIILSQLLINKILYYGVYSSSCFTIAELVCTVALISIVYNSRLKPVLKKAFITVFSLIYIFWVVGFIILLPKYTMFQALNKIKLEQPALYEVTVNDEYSTMQLTSYSGLINSVYCISAYDNKTDKIIYFNPSDGTYNIAEK